MSRWLRILVTLIRARFRGTVHPQQETSLGFRVWPTDVDLTVMNHAAMLAIMEMGRLDLMCRTGFLRHARKNRWHVPMASISVRFVKSLKRFQKFEVKTKILYWDEKWVYIRHGIVREDKIVAIALAKATVKKGREPVAFDRIIREFGWEVKPSPRPEMIDWLEKAEMLLFKDPTAHLKDSSWFTRV